jgi:hypothetical protein
MVQGSGREYSVSAGSGLTNGSALGFPARTQDSSRICVHTRFKPTTSELELLASALIHGYGSLFHSRAKGASGKPAFGFLGRDVGGHSDSLGHFQVAFENLDFGFLGWKSGPFKGRESSLLLDFVISSEPAGARRRRTSRKIPRMFLYLKCSFREFSRESYPSIPNASLAPPGNLLRCRLA